MTRVHLLGDSPVRLWGLTGRERLLRQLRSLGELTLVRDLSELSGYGRVLLLRADYVLEQRALKGLMELDGVLVQNGAPVAAHIDAASAADALRVLEGSGAGGLPTFGVEDLDAFERDLRKVEPPLVAPVTAESAPDLENRLYGASYKGITDFVTKWWWPRPAKAGVRWCSLLRISPNMVTATGFLLMLAVCALFYHGQYGIGLMLAWFMTYLDTVDGKLARVTAQSSRFGHFLDHGMDILHPPFWYWLWGLSLADFQPIAGIDQAALYAAIFVGYAGGRVIEAVFNILGETSIFAWRPFDAYFRLYTARRNPCLVLLTIAWALGSPVAGLWLVAGWTVLSTVIMLLRLIYGAWVRITEGRLQSWLATPDAERRYPRAYASFSATRSAYV
jgi:phosphatidylglycerophosphate synthase